MPCLVGGGHLFRSPGTVNVGPVRFRVRWCSFNTCLSPFIVRFVIAAVEFMPSFIISIFVLLRQVGVVRRCEVCRYFVLFFWLTVHCDFFYSLGHFFIIFVCLGSMPFWFLACFVSLSCLASSFPGVSANSRFFALEVLGSDTAVYSDSVYTL